MILLIRIVRAIDRRQAEKNAKLAIHAADPSPVVNATNLARASKAPGEGEGERPAMSSESPEASPVRSESVHSERVEATGEIGPESIATSEGIDDPSAPKERGGRPATMEQASATAATAKQKAEGSALKTEDRTRGPARCLSWSRAVILAACTFVLGGVAVGIVTLFREPPDLRLSRDFFRAAQARTACHREAERAFLASNPPPQPHMVDATGRGRVTVADLYALDYEPRKAKFLTERCHREEVEVNALELTIRLRSEGSR